MRRAWKVLVWTFVFLGAAGVGAFIAAHSNPFPPSVESSPRSSPTSGPSSTPAPVWKGTIQSASYHQLYVGGRCETDWRGSIAVIVRSDESVRGTASVRRTGALRCDFSTAQGQIAKLGLTVRGSATAGGFELQLTEASSTPSSGADDYGGLVRTVLQPGARSTLSLRATPQHAAGVLAMHMVDREGRGTYVSRTRVRLHCALHCS